MGATPIVKTYIFVLYCFVFWRKSTRERFFVYSKYLLSESLGSISSRAGGKRARAQSAGNRAFKQRFHSCKATSPVNDTFLVLKVVSSRAPAETQEPEEFLFCSL